MQLRSALPVAVLLGCVVGASMIGSNHLASGPDAPLSPVPALIATASAATLSTVSWDIPVVRNSAVERFIEIFSEKQPDRMALYLKRSGRYEGMIRAKLREQGMPEDLLYLSMIESGFNPTARSKASAVGLWQFVEGTGEAYGLRIDAYVDERRDPEKSTDAALRYLQDLHGQFGAWYLAAAAYNSGGNRVSRVMREVTGAERGVEDDFWRIRRALPAETREYVPLMLAAALIGKEPHRYGLGGVERYLPPPTERVRVPGGIDLEVVGASVGVSEKEMRTLNPELHKGMTPPRDESYIVRIPEGRGSAFAVNFTRARAEAAARTALEEDRRAKVAVAERADRARARTHTVRKGESLWTIARRNDTTVAALKRANGLQGSAVRPGQKLRLPG
ncbi:MAG: transglycosylase SLT domain-containing protein [Gemmatimonadota bacterium]|nr:transglycosylase SLT domain-containing protein [Gemmatimonadota bacterium]